MGEPKTEEKDSREPNERLWHGVVGRIRNGEEEAMQTSFGFYFQNSRTEKVSASANQSDYYVHA